MTLDSAMIVFVNGRESEQSHCVCTSGWTNKFSPVCDNARLTATWTGEEERQGDTSTLPYVTRQGLFLDDLPLFRHPGNSSNLSPATVRYVRSVIHRSAPRGTGTW